MLYSRLILLNFILSVLTLYPIHANQRNSHKTLLSEEIAVALSNELYAGSSDSIAEPPVFTPVGGFYSEPLYISIVPPTPSAQIRYTLNGDTPTHNSPLFTEPIYITSTTPVRATTFEDGKAPSEVVTSTYFVNEQRHLPVISIVTDSVNLFCDTIGIYVTGVNGIRGACDPTPRNLNQDWEREANIELYELDGTVDLSQRFGLSIFGGCSRTRYPQKSFALHSRAQYGTGSFRYQLFPDKPNRKYESFILRSSADDQVYTMLKCAYAQETMKKYMDIDYQAYRPAVVYINGQYWGIHNMREKLNRHYPADNYNVDRDEVNLLRNNANTQSGSNSSYTHMLNYATNNDLVNQADYDYVAERMDIDQYIDYQIANIHLTERDWPGNNIKYWNTNGPSHTKWRWIQFDRDQTYIHTYDNTLEEALDPSGTSWPNPEWSTRLFRNLIENDSFRNQFIQTYAYHLNTTFVAERLIEILDDMKSVIEPEIPRHIERWGGKVDPDMNEHWSPPPTFNSLEEWEENLDNIRYFAHNRTEPAIEHIVNYFSISGLSEVSIVNDINMGIIKLYNKTIPKYAYTAPYFNGIPLKITAFANPGFAFSHWQVSQGNSTEVHNEASIIITPSSSGTSLMAHFTESETSFSPPIVVNEINYYSATEYDAHDWIEFYNRTPEPIDLTGWYIQDDNELNIYHFPIGQQIAGNSYLVVCENYNMFHSIYPEVSNAIGNFGFGLGRNGDMVRLFNNHGELINSVEYTNKPPWDTLADGYGYTLELIDPSLDNSKAESWRSGEIKGTPGRRNQMTETPTGVLSVPTSKSQNITLGNNYPNPFSYYTTIPYRIEIDAHVKIEVYSPMGSRIETLYDGWQQAGNHSLKFKSSSLPPGVYFYRIILNNKHMKVGKMVKAAAF